MYGRRAFAGIDLSRWRLTRARVFALAALLLSVSVGTSFYQFGNAKDLQLPAGGFVGGDYLAFYAAGEAARAGDAASTYDPVAFEALLHEVGPEKDRFGLTWQYPPTYFLFVLPFAFLAFVPGYVAFVAGTAGAFFASLRSAGIDRLSLFVVLASPSVFHAAITGQNGFLTAALLAIAALYPDKRPIAAGLAAALLTVKPQFGVLIPIAYLAAGCWRAFFVAAVGALAFAGASVLAFGADIWVAFLDAVRGASGNLASGLMPLYKMATPFSAFRLAGLSAEISMALHAVCALAAAIGVALVWRRVKDAELRAAALVASVFIAAPYGFFYELVLLALPAAIVAKRALEKGWLPYEQVALLFSFLMPLQALGLTKRLGVSVGLVVALAVAATVFRRIAHEEPQTFRPLFRFASGAFRPRRD